MREGVAARESGAKTRWVIAKKRTKRGSRVVVEGQLRKGREGFEKVSNS